MKKCKLITVVMLSMFIFGCAYNPTQYEEMKQQRDSDENKSMR